MRYEDWAFRKIEIRLQEHIELRMAFERHPSANEEQLSNQKIQSAKSYRDCFLWSETKTLHASFRSLTIYTCDADYNSRACL